MTGASSERRALPAVIVTGLSGAGKHQVLYALEDMGYRCMDNLPAAMLTSAWSHWHRLDATTPVAFGLDARTGNPTELRQAVRTMKKNAPALRVLFLEASEAELIRRFSETRRAHPGRTGATLRQRIRAEFRDLEWLRTQADWVVDTTLLRPPELRRRLQAWLGQSGASARLVLSSFGFKHGLPGDADWVFDVRFLPNPFYVPRLKTLTGNDAAVRRFVLRSALARPALDRMADLLRLALPGFHQEGKTSVHAAVGCTGGQHRSVVMVNALRRRLPGVVAVVHRDLPEGRKSAHG